MRRISIAVFIMLCASGLTLPVALALPAPAHQTPKPGQSPAYSSLTRDLLKAQRCMRGCHDCWYKYFPGAVNYCLGIRDWKKGSYRSGLELLELAAGWGSKKAQYALGLIYYNGRHVAADRARGIAWLMLANERHNNAQRELVARSVVQLATDEQYERAQQLLQKMRKRYGDNVAAVRAWRHLRNRLTLSFPRLPKTSCILEGGGVVPWSSGLSADPHVLCMPSRPFGKNVASIAGKYFDGLTATVNVGPLQQVSGPASSSTR